MDASRIIALCATLLSGLVAADLTLKPAGDEHTYFTKENFVVTCLVGNGDIQSLVWFGPQDNQITENDGRIHVESSREVSESGPLKGIVLMVEDVRLEDAGTYKCSAVIDGEEQSVSFNLVIHGSINFENTELHQYAPEGSNMTVVCNVDGDPKPTINWEFKGIQLQQDSKYHVNGGQLTIYDVKRSDAGNYTCGAFLITSGKSQIKSKNITVHIQHAPEWVERYPEDAYSSVGHMVNLSCEAQGEPTPTFVWKRNNETVHTNHVFVKYDEVNKTILQINVHNESLFGNYTCQASNVIKTVEKTIVLKEGDTPVAPVFSVVSEEAGTLMVDISPPAESSLLEVIGYKVEYKLSTDNWSDAHSKEFDIGHRHILKNLVHDADYVVRVAAKNAVGYGEYSAEIVARTKKTNSPTISDNNSALVNQFSSIGVVLSTTALLWIQRL
ncbi:neural cell adhesion molecule 1-like [Centruroides sculpturatus]|uniref:neural cell adhesion molecule 1-like n=1 Tax=Centruroides sculpturatus TaxID=218467 RepID=UPI000C6E4E52|nr:neural cell adhesion molecule 1-like [Centruroides sculpturatus]